MKAYSKDFIREFLKNKGRFISVFFIVMLGAAFFSGIRSGKSDMIASADLYYKKYKLMDIKVQGTLGITKKDIEDISNISGVKVAEGGYYVEAICKMGAKQEELKVIGMPQNINIHILKDGREPKTVGECLVDYRFLENTGYKIGDYVSLQSGTSEHLYNKLKYVQYKIVGVCALPYYMDIYRDYSTIGDGKLESFIVVDPSVFKDDVYSELAIGIEESSKYSAYDEKYKDIVKTYVDQIDGLADMFCKRRYQEVFSKGNSQIKEAEKEIRDAEKELSDARNKIVDGEKKLNEAKTTINAKENDLDKASKTIINKKKELDDAKKTLQVKDLELKQGKSTLLSKEKQLINAKDEISKNKEQLLASKQLISVQEDELNRNKKIIEYNIAVYEESKKLLEQQDVFYADKKTEFDDLKAEFENIKSTLDENVMREKENELATIEMELLKQREILDASKKQIEQQGEELNKAREELSKGEIEIVNAKEKIDAGEKELAIAQETIISGEKEISKAKIELDFGEKEIKKANSQIISGEKELAKAKKQVTNGKKALKNAKEELKDNEDELNDAKKIFLKEEKDAVKLIKEGKKEVKKVKKELSKIEVPELYVTTREDIYSCNTYILDADRVSSLGNVFPVIFFMVAALVSLTAMTRMVEEQRQQIGVLKALGYGRKAIMMKYLAFALIPTVLGAVAGVLIGEKVLPLIIIMAYNMLYTGLTEVQVPYNFEQGGLAIIICVVCICLATILACYKETRTKPSELMRPKAPKQGRRVLLERIFIWRFLDFTAKSTFRNIFRYKKRLIMTIVGVGGCMGLILVALGLRDSVTAIATEQYGKIVDYDAIVYLKEDISNNSKKKAVDKSYGLKGVEDILEIRCDTVIIKEKNIERDASLIIANDENKLDEYVLFNDRETHKIYKLPKEGVIISERMAEEMNIKEGDSINLEVYNQKVNVIVKHIMENYMDNYVYMSKHQYKKLYGKLKDNNQLLIKLKDTSDKTEKNFGNKIMKEEAVGGICFITDVKEIVDNMLTAIVAVVYVLLVSAGLLAFVVLYNLNNINIAERHRELATLKVLGFYDNEVTQYVFRENMILTILGIVAGIFIGQYLHGFVIESISMEGIMFGTKINTISYLIGGVITIIFAMFVNIVMSKSLKQIDMIESLKSVE